MGYAIGIDVGRTFTDVVVLDKSSKQIKVLKSRSKRTNPAKSVIEALRETHIWMEEIDFIIHGTTTITNIIVEKKKKWIFR